MFCFQVLALVAGVLLEKQVVVVCQNLVILCVEVIMPISRCETSASLVHFVLIRHLLLFFVLVIFFFNHEESNNRVELCVSFEQ